MSPHELNPEQRQAAERLDGRLLIAAGAGSGKTRVLTERCVNALVEGVVDGWTPVLLGDVLAITYTEKAAGELAERVRVALRAAGRIEEARAVDAAWITTIHGMCARILRQSALEAAIDPGFRVLDSVEAGTLREQAFERAAVKAVERAGGRGLFAAYSYDGIAETVFDLSDALRVRSLRAADVVTEPCVRVGSLIDEAVALFRDLHERLLACDRDEEYVHQYAAICEAVIEGAPAIGSSGMTESEAATAFRQLLAQFRLPSRHAGVTDVRREMKAALESLALRAAPTMTVPFCEALLQLTDDFTSEFAALKRESGGLDFDDLQSEALRVLTQPDTAAEWADRFALVMIDEFQDTDALQLELVERLGSDRLCTVGDEQQAIYGFRGADIAVYREHRRRMESTGAHRVELVANYRSHAAVLDFVNRVFGDESVFGDDLVRLTADPTRTPSVRCDVPHPVELLIAEKTRPEMASRRLLANSIAERIAGLCQQGVPQGDIVILLRGYTHAGVYAAALRNHEIDALIVGGSRFFEQREVAALRALVRVIGNQRDEEALCRLLASDLFHVSDDCLLALRRETQDGHASSLWEAAASAPVSVVDRRRLEVCERTIANARARLGRSPLSDVVLRAVEDSGYDARMLGEGLDGDQKYANMLKFVRLAREFEQGRSGGPQAFSAYLDAKEQYRDHEPPASLVKDGSDAVRIMSIHKSKGLEFPVVFVPEMGAGHNSDKSLARWRLGERAVIALKAPGSSGDKTRFSPLFTELGEEAKADDAQETRRLLYVACTRAQDLLVLAGACAFGKPADGTPLGIVMKALGVDATPGMDGAYPADGPVVHVRTLAGHAPDEPQEAGPPPAEDPNAHLAWLEAVIPPAEGPETPSPLVPSQLSYTGLRRYESCGLRFKMEKLFGGSMTMRKRGGPFDFGSAAHAVLELFGETRPLDADRLASVARYHGLDAQGLSRLERAVERYRGSRMARRVAAIDDVRRESPFSLWLEDGDDGFVLGGAIDVLARTDDGPLIVDYKTGTSPMTDEEMAEEYRTQAVCYALAALRQTGDDAAEVVFVRIEAGDGDEPPTVTFRVSRAEAETYADRARAARCGMRAGVYEHRESWDAVACDGCPVTSAACGARRTHETRA